MIVKANIPAPASSAPEMSMPTVSQGPLNALNGPSDEQLARIRASMRAMHEKGLSWAKIAAQYRISKGTAYHVAIEGHTPRDPRILAALLGNHFEVVIQQIRRDGRGRFSRRSTGPRREEED